MSSADFGFMTLRNMTAYQTNGGRVKQNYLLTTSTNGTAYFSDSIRLSSINVSSLGASSISANTIIASIICADTIDVNNLSTSTHVSNNILASSITLENYVLSPLGNFNTINTSTINGLLGYISSLSSNSISTNTIATNYLTATYISSVSSLIFNDNNNSTIELIGFADDLYVNGYPVVTEGNISSISSLYWEDTLGTGSLAGAIFNKNLGAGVANYMVGVGTGANLNGTLSVQYTGGNVVGNSFHVSSNNNYTYLKNAWDGANNGLSLYLEENQPTCCGPRIYLSKSYNFQSSVVGDLGAIKFTGTNGAISSILGAEITAQQTGVPSTFVPTDIAFINCTSSISTTNMIIKSGGNVGIGTTVPQGKLDVGGNMYVYGDIFTSSVGSNSALLLRTGASASFIETGTSINSTQGNTLIITNPGSTLPTAPFVVDTQNVRVGVKNQLPQYPLDVGGITQINWGPGSGRIGTTTVNEGFAMTWNAVQAGSTNGQTELISGRGAGSEGGFDFFVNVADGVAAVAGDLAMRIDGSTKYVGIGTTTPAHNLHVVGDIYASGNITAGSDIRFKTDIKTIENALSTVNNMRGVSYTSLATQAKSIGVIAQEVEKVLPEVVLTDNSDDKFKSVAYGNIVGLLIEAIKELNRKIDNL
jgi:hypothetical protein